MPSPRFRSLTVVLAAAAAAGFCHLAEAQLFGGAAEGPAPALPVGVDEPGMYAISNDGEFLRVDTDNGVGTNLGVYTGDRSFHKEFEYGDGVYYVVYDNDEIVSVDAPSFAQTNRVVVSLPAGFDTLTALEFVGGTLYGAASVVGGNLTSSRLVAVEPVNGATTDLGDMGTVGPVTGLAWDGQTMYAVNGGSTGSVLYTVDLNSGLASAVGSVLEGGSGFNLTGLEFDPNGALYGVTNRQSGGDLVKIDKGSGDAAAIGPVTGAALGSVNGLTSVPLPPPGDDCDDAITIGLGTTPYDLAPASPSTANGSCVGTLSFPDLYYTYTAQATGDLTLSVCDVEAVAAVQVYRNTTCPVDISDEILCEGTFNTPEPGCVGFLQTVIPVVLGDEITIRLSRDFPATNFGELTLSLAGDTCDNTIVVTDGVTPYDMALTTYEGPTPSCFSAGNPDRWYTYTATTTGVVEIQVCDQVGGSGCIGFEVWEGSACPFSSGAEIACLFGTSVEPACEGALETAFATEAGSTYLIRLTTCDTDQFGDITLTPVPCGFENNSFETGDFTGWTTQDLSDPFMNLEVVLAPLLPTEGNWSAFHGFDGSAGKIKIAQDAWITQPGVSFTWRAEWFITVNGPTLDRRFEVVVRDLGGIELQRTPVLVARANTEEVNTGARRSTVDVSAFIGQQVNVCLEWTIPETFTGPASFTIDNICQGPAPCVGDTNTTNMNPGEPGYGLPDGQVDGADLSFYVENWLAGAVAVADVNTSNTNPGDPGYGQPNGTVDGSDLSFFVENWLAGCP